MRSRKGAKVMSTRPKSAGRRIGWGRQCSACAAVVRLLRSKKGTLQAS